MLTERQEYIINQVLENFDFKSAHTIFVQLGLTFGDFPPHSEAYIPDEKEIEASVKEGLVFTIEKATEENSLYSRTESNYFRIYYWIEDIEDGGEECISVEFVPLSNEMRYGRDGYVSAINGGWDYQD